MSVSLLQMVSRGPAQDWTQTSAPSQLWSGVASSADGSKLVAAARFTGRGFNPSGVYVSTNSGRTWRLTSAPIQYWGRVASSADGTQLFVIGADNPSWPPGARIYRSGDAGSTWTATSDAGYIYTWQLPPTLSIAPSGGGILLSWPANASDFVLQQNADLSATGWMDATNSVTQTKSGNQVFIPNPIGKSFYRLRANY